MITMEIKWGTTLEDSICVVQTGGTKMQTYLHDCLMPAAGQTLYEPLLACAR